MLSAAKSLEVVSNNFCTNYIKYSDPQNHYYIILFKY